MGAATTKLILMPENEEEQNENKEELSAELAAQQDLYAAQKGIDDFHEEGRSYSKPSYFKYGILFALAGIIDLVDLVDATGVGIIISKIVSFSLTGAIYGIILLTGTKYKKAQEYVQNATERIQDLQKTISRAEQRLAKFSGALGKSRMPGARKAGRAVARGVSGIKKLAYKNPATKVLIGGALNMVPYLAILNIMVIWIYFVYRDEKEALQTAREMSEISVQESPATIA